MSSQPQLMSPDPEQLRLAVLSWLAAVPSPNIPAQTIEASCLTLGAKPVACRSPVFSSSRKRRASQTPSPTEPISPPATITTPTTITTPADAAELLSKMADARQSTARTPSPNKKRKTGRDDRDPDATPRGWGIHPPDDATTPRPPVAFPPRPSLSYSDSVSSLSRSSGRSSGRGSPTKKERSLRQTTDFPVRRIILSEPGNSITDLPDSVVLLMRDLKAIGSGDEGVIPDMFYETMCRENTILNQPKRHWFVKEDGAEDEVRYRDRRLRSIWSSSLECTRRSEHEAGWNDSVHGPLLDEALYDISIIARRNITSTRISSAFRDTDPELGETKVDYGLFLQSTPDSKLATLSRSVPVVHIDLPDAPQTPLAVSIETKSLSARITDGPTQLANWARAHFRHMELVCRPPVLAATPLEGLSIQSPDNPTLQPTLVASTIPVLSSDIGPRQLPVLPLIFVLGNRWSISFAQRANGQTLIWQDVPLGDTNTLEGCYFVLHCLRRLAAWADIDIRSWWEDALAAKMAE